MSGNAWRTISIYPLEQHTYIIYSFNHESIKAWANVPRGGMKNSLVPSLTEDIVSNGLVLMEDNECLTSSTENQRASSNSVLSTSRGSSPENDTNFLKCILFSYNISYLPLTMAWHPIIRLLVGKDQC